MRVKRSIEETRSLQERIGNVRKKLGSKHFMKHFLANNPKYKDSQQRIRAILYSRTYDATVTQDLEKFADWWLEQKKKREYELEEKSR